MDQQIRALKRGVDIVVATPGRALDHMRRTTLELDRAAGARARRSGRDARHGLRRGSRGDPRRRRPTTRQTALFSATMPPRIAAIAQRHLKNPSRITIAREKRAAGKAAARAAGRRTSWRAAEDRRRSAACSNSKSRSRRSCSAARGIEVDSLTETLDASRLPRAGAARRHDAAAARSRDAAVPRGQGRRARRHRRRRARARHRARLARDQLRRADGGRSLRAPHRPHGPHRPRGRRDHAGRSARARGCCSNIEAFTKQKIEIVTLPTAADLRRGGWS